MPEYRVGDVVRVTQTVRLTVVGLLGGEAVSGEDVQSGYTVPLIYPNMGTTRVEMVKRTPEMHNGPRPLPDTILKGKDLRRIWWKRGTIIRCISSENGTPITGYSGMVLRADGKWHTLDNDPAWSQTYEFEDLAANARFELRFVA